MGMEGVGEGKGGRMREKENVGIQITGKAAVEEVTNM